MVPRANRRWNSPGYTLGVKAIAPILLLSLFVAGPVSAADPPLSHGVSGAPVSWSDWVAKRGPVAVVVWASWAPGADRVLADYEDIGKAAEKQALTLFLLDVQETLDNGRAALEQEDLTWLHDRHGALLKQYRVIRVPSILIVAADGSGRGIIDASADALTAWGSQ